LAFASLADWEMDYLASNGFKDATFYAGGKSFENLNTGLQTAYNAWTTSPTIGSFHIVADLPALFIIVLITAWCIVESKPVHYGIGETVHYSFGDSGWCFLLILITGLLLHLTVSVAF
jgi:hypothetical protein